MLDFADSPYQSMLSAAKYLHYLLVSEAQAKCFPLEVSADLVSAETVIDAALAIDPSNRGDVAAFERACRKQSRIVAGRPYRQKTTTAVSATERS